MIKNVLTLLVKSINKETIKAVGSGGCTRKLSFNPCVMYVSIDKNLTFLLSATLYLLKNLITNPMRPAQRTYYKTAFAGNCYLENLIFHFYYE